MGYRYPGNESRAAVELYPVTGRKVTAAATEAGLAVSSISGRSCLSQFPQFPSEHLILQREIQRQKHDDRAKPHLREKEHRVAVKGSGPRNPPPDDAQHKTRKARPHQNQHELCFLTQATLLVKGTMNG